MRIAVDTYPWARSWDQEASCLVAACLEREAYPCQEAARSVAAYVLEDALTSSFVINFYNYFTYKYYNKQKGEKRSSGF